MEETIIEIEEDQPKISPRGYGPEYVPLGERHAKPEHWKTKKARLRKETSVRSQQIIEEGEKQFRSEAK